MKVVVVLGAAVAVVVLAGAFARALGRSFLSWCASEPEDGWSG